jgi:hypothetical protein
MSNHRAIFHSITNAKTREERGRKIALGEFLYKTATIMIDLLGRTFLSQASSIRISHSITKP